MNINELLTAISTVGFPIVMCGALLKLCYVLLDKLDKLDKELVSLRTAINKNTAVMEKISEKENSK